jgi:hypothetical protein
MEGYVAVGPIIRGSLGLCPEWVPPEGNFATSLLRGEVCNTFTGGMAVPCTQVYSGASVATEAREFIYSLGCMFVSNFLVNPDAGLIFRVTRLLADRSLGARFADVCLAIGFVSQWPGTPSPILSV